MAGRIWRRQGGRTPPAPTGVAEQPEVRRTGNDRVGVPDGGPALSLSTMPSATPWDAPRFVRRPLKDRFEGVSRTSSAVSPVGGLRHRCRALKREGTVQAGEVEQPDHRRTGCRQVEGDVTLGGASLGADQHGQPERIAGRHRG